MADLDWIEEEDITLDEEYEELQLTPGTVKPVSASLPFRVRKFFDRTGRGRKSTKWSFNTGSIRVSLSGGGTCHCVTHSTISINYTGISGKKEGSS